MAGAAFVGTSGYVYADWRRRFYPRSLPATAWLSFYARAFDTVELNRPFYRLPPHATFAAWRRAVPTDFVFSVKASRFLTHMKKLTDPEEPLARFLDAARGLGPTLGPVLFQLPARFHANVPRLDGFLRALVRQRRVPRLRAVLEVRHLSWLEPVVLARLEEAGVALCLADWRAVPVTGPLTADFVYVRRHGPPSGSYSARQIRADARSVRAWLREGRDVYVYFNNDARARAVANARRLRDLLAGGVRPAPDRRRAA